MDSCVGQCYSHSANYPIFTLFNSSNNWFTQLMLMLWWTCLSSPYFFSYKWFHITIKTKPGQFVFNSEEIVYQSVLKMSFHKNCFKQQSFGNHKTQNIKEKKWYFQIRIIFRLIICFEGGQSHCLVEYWKKFVTLYYTKTYNLGLHSNFTYVYLKIQVQYAKNVKLCHKRIIFNVLISWW